MTPPTRTQEVMAAIRRRIEARGLTPGERLPSIRAFAATMHVSPSTVVEAYDRLAAEGLIQARRGAGFFVRDTPQPLQIAAAGPRLDRAIDPFWVSRQSLDADPALPKPGCGWLPADWMPTASLRRALRALSRADDEVLTDYGSVQGPAGLRRLIARALGEQGLELPPDRILLTGSGSQSMDLICRLLLRPGDTVLVDDPCYFNFQALLRAHQVRLVPVPYTPQGPDIARFEAVLVAEKPRLYLTNSALHNPTGATISAQIAHRVLTLATRHDLTIIEDDIFAEFEPEPSPRLASLDGLERVIRIGSFSKTLSASMRCGYIAARPDWIAALVDLQVATSFGGPSPMATQLLHAALADGGYRKHMAALRARLARARRQTATRLAGLGITPWLLPRGGFYLWCRLPEGTDAADVARAALRENIVLAPGNAFSVTRSLPDFMRFNVSQMGGPEVDAVLARALAQAHRVQAHRA
ncbi:PLP-dependent aminotransferase family protein [Stappia sp.]|uniref:aminotransferase-like domain-containing protein n=1 Tax=Stappia sp. TaxID=1870903 RepID=UPI003A9A5898